MRAPKLNLLNLAVLLHKENHGSPLTLHGINIHMKSPPATSLASPNMGNPIVHITSAGNQRTHPN